MIAWGKSAALHWLAPRLRSACVPPGHVIGRERWLRERAACVQELCTQTTACLFAVRSDAKVEDQAAASCAGQFTSLLDVPFLALEAAIERVFADMPGDAADAVLIQPMVAQARWVGVASTHRVKDGAPWYCIELAEAGPAAVTDGRASGRLVAVARQAVDDDDAPASPPVRAVLATLRDVERLAGDTPLEIEFAVHDGETPTPTVTLLQARPLATVARWHAMPAVLPLPRLDALLLRDPEHAVAGRRTVLSLMSDWNPAELLGTHPRPLALSLFQRLIGDGVWWRARARLGYETAPTPSVALLHPVAGRPYVDVRRSANSLLPAGMAAESRERLVDAWLQPLLASPELHDKVEFCVFRTARDFTAADSVARRWAARVGERTQRDWEQRLGGVTRSAMQQSLEGRHRDCLVAMEAADPRRLDWRDALAACGIGTEEFAVLARLAFIAEAQLRSAVEREALSPARAHALRHAIGSVGCLLDAESDDAVDAAWHLRPGTFDITQAVRGVPERRLRVPAERFELRPEESRRLRALLAESGFHHDAAEWLRFVARACRAREWGKFVFTRHLSAAMESMAGEFEALDLDRDTASWLSLSVVDEARAMPIAQRASFLAELAQSAAANHQAERALMLSPLLASERDGWIADSLGVLPNFIGDEIVTGPLVTLDERANASGELRGAVVVLRNADPGYDFLFSHGIRGLITAWGGAHSHMAIRCAEFGLSAAIGCGEAVFRRTRRAAQARIDPVQGSLWLGESTRERAAWAATA